MQRGTVKWFNDAKGYGFIRPTPDDPNVPDIFVHHSVIDGDGFRTLEDGQGVSFESTERTKGIMATRVVADQKAAK